MTDSIFFLELVLLTTALLALVSIVLAWPDRKRLFASYSSEGERKSRPPRVRMRLRQTRFILLLLWSGYALFLVFLLVDTGLASHWRATYDSWRAADVDPTEVKAEVEATTEETTRWTGWWIVFTVISAIPLASTFGAYRRMGLSVRWKPRRFALLVTTTNILLGYLALIILLAVFWPAVLGDWVAALNIAWEPSRELFPGT